MGSASLWTTLTRMDLRWGAGGRDPMVGGDSEVVIGSIGARPGVAARRRARIRDATVSLVRSSDRW